MLSIAAVLAARSHKMSKTPTTTLFIRCPAEVWHHIEEQLEFASDRAALALTCRTALIMFGKNTISTLRQPEQRKDLLKLLFRLLTDFPKHYLCGECVKFHLKTTPFASYPASDLVLCDGSKWSFAGLQVFMKYCDRITEPQLSTHDTQRDGVKWNFKVLGRLVNGRLLLTKRKHLVMH